ncbi:MAG TPA: hypothetical protein VIF57_23875 [Polyangia bacterium]
MVLAVGAVIAPLAIARASTEVMHIKANNTFANAVSSDPATGSSIGVFVTREKGNKGGPVDTIFFVISSASGEFVFGGGTLPKGAFHADAHSASLDVAVSDIAFTSQAGEIPPDGVISIDWQATDVTRTSGNTKFEFGNVKVNFVGTGASSPAEISGTVLGASLISPTGDLTSLHQGTIIVTKDE